MEFATCYSSIKAVQVKLNDSDGSERSKYGRQVVVHGLMVIGSWVANLAGE